MPGGRADFADDGTTDQAKVLGRESLTPSIGVAPSPQSQLHF
jgi:hypothetical protein